jgi:hypothetical protein
MEAYLEALLEFEFLDKTSKFCIRGTWAGDALGGR